MRSARGVGAYSSSGGPPTARKFQAAASDYNRASAFQMPASTSHTSHQSPSKTTSSNAQQRGQSPTRSTTMAGSADQQHQSYSESDQNLLAMLNSTVACLKEKSMDIEALGCLEQSLWLKRRMFGLESSAVRKALHEVMLSYNSIAMQFLAMGQFDQCLSMLRKAEAITGAPGNFPNCQSLQILTYNNIGCCYRKLGKLKSALKYLQEAAQIGAGCAHVKNLSITHLNLCAIQSQLGRHDLALEHAQAAIFHTQEELVSVDGDTNTNADTDHSGDDVLDAKSREEKIVSLAVAYHNLAVELEFNGRGEASLQWYKKARQLVGRFQQTNLALCDSFDKIFLDAKRKYQGTKQTPPVAYTTATATTRPTRTTGASARPQSAHPPARGGGPPGVAAVPRDVSYSSTVASHCYKPTKPSIAGLQYTRTAVAATAASPAKRASAAKNRLSAPQPRPVSATTSRRRPLSASATATSTRWSSSRFAAMEREDALGDSVEQRWQQIERELFGGGGGGSRNPTALNAGLSTSGSGSGARPQSARIDRTSSPGRRARDRKAHALVVDEQLLQDDGECGIIQDGSDNDNDDSNDDDDDDDAYQPPSYQQRPSHPTRAATQPRKQVHSTKQSGVSTSKRRDVVLPPSARHRHVLEEKRRRDVCNAHERDSDAGLSASSGSAAGEEEEYDDAAAAALTRELSLSSSSELPHQRVSHLEYLRRMKKLSDNIHDDLTGAFNKALSSCSDRVTTSSREPVTGTSSTGSATSSLADDGATPRSKVRERIELVRRESVKSLVDANVLGGEEEEEEAAAAPRALPAAQLVVQESVNAFSTERDRSRAEQQLLRAAAARSIQKAARRDAARCQVCALREIREQEEAARQLQKLAKQKAIEVREYELQAQREARHVQRQHHAARLIQSAYRRKYRAAIPEQQQSCGQEMDQAVTPASDDEYDEVDEEDSGDYTPAPSARSTGSRRGSEDATATATATATAAAAAAESSKGSLTARSSLDGSGSESDVPSFSSSSSPVSFPVSASSTPRVVFQSSDRRLMPSAATQQAAALRIQCAFRSHRASRFVTSCHARRLSRSYIEHTHFALALKQAEANELAFLEELSAIKIQALTRGRQARFLVDATRIGRHAAASSIQRGFQCHQRRLHRAASYGVRSLAARTIQQAYRAVASRQAQRQQAELNEEALQVHHFAAQTIQKRWRSWSLERERCVEECEAATCIQSLHRGYQARKSCQALHASASRASAFSIDQDDRAPESRCSSRGRIREEAVDVDAYEELFEEEEDEDDEPGEVRRKADNAAYLPPQVRALAERYALDSSMLDQFPPAPSHAVKEMVHAGYGLDEIVAELARCADAESVCALLDAINGLVDLHTDRFRTLPSLMRVATALETRIQDTHVWTLEVEGRAAAFVARFRDLLLAEE